MIPLYPLRWRYASLTNLTALAGVIIAITAAGQRGETGLARPTDWESLR
ncbi:MAG: hypothetical protein JXB15_08205 [Anaerolineales bacterium]|nr:hypothetical protein [Anaerolineales bacterium]